MSCGCEIVTDEIREIAKTYRDQMANSGYADTPGGLEHMGDVWSLLMKWDALINASKCTATALAESNRDGQRLINELNHELANKETEATALREELEAEKERADTNWNALERIKPKWEADRAELERVKALNVKMLEVLKPFAVMDRPCCDLKEIACSRGTASDMTIITSKDFRNAADIVAETTKEK